MSFPFPVRKPTQEETELDQAEADRMAQERLFETQLNAHLWGFLKPYNPAYAQVDFWRLKGVYKIGRLGDDSVDISIPGIKISSLHCTLRWDGKTGLNSQVVVFDHSSNGTFINGSKIGKGRCAVLRDNDFLSFASPGIIKNSKGEEDDYRFQFHHMVVRAAKLVIDALYTAQVVIGSGAFGTVSKALDHTHNRMVAIKTIVVRKHDPRAPKSESRSKILRSIGREVTIMERLRHPNICELFQFYYDHHTSQIHIVMEYVEGGDLFNFITSHDLIDEHLGQHFCYEICTGIKYLHVNGVSHRDIKPENILLTHDNPPRVKITDFGLSKNFSDTSFLLSQVGTFHYMAPEFFQPSDAQTDYTYIVDSWAIGVVAYAIFTKEHPWETVSGNPTPVALLPPSYCSQFKALSSLCQIWIQRLMDPSTETRMSVNAALTHAWLQDWNPIYNNADWESSHPPDAVTSRGESWQEALDLLEEEAMAAEQEELGLSTVHEDLEYESEEGKVIKTVRVVEVEHTHVARAKTRKVTGMQQQPSTGLRRSSRNAEKELKKFTRKGTPYPR